MSPRAPARHLARVNRDQRRCAPGLSNDPGVVTAGSSLADLLIRSFSSLPGLKYGTCLGGTSTLSPVLGLRPRRDSRRRRRKLPNPRSSIFSPRCSASTMLWKTESTITSECFFVRFAARATSSTSSALVIGETAADGPAGSRPPARRTTRVLLQVPEMVAERHFRTARGLGIRFPVGAVLCVAKRPDAQPDLPLLGHEPDDLHLVGLTRLEFELVAALRRVELRDVNQSFDPVGQFDERADVRPDPPLACVYVDDYGGL